MGWLGSVALASLLVGSVADAHDWYSGLTSNAGQSCCNERDCRQVPYRLSHAGAREEIHANGRWWPIEWDKVLPIASPDGEAHACWDNPRGKPRFRCIILPGQV